MLSFPNAKINLGLNIIKKREDGYHSIESCFYPVLWQDVLEIIEHQKPEFTSSGISIPGDPKDNLCIKAYQLLYKDFGIPPVKIHLHKNIPIGAGLGGGSADGAFALKMLSDKFNLMLNNTLLEDYAAQLGSDCPFFISNRPSLIKGRGEIFEETSLSLKGKHIVIVNPQIHISTKEAYAGVKPAVPETPVKDIINLPVTKWKDILKNDFEDSVFPKYPEIRRIKEFLYNSGAEYASMTGSGASVFGIFEKEPEEDIYKKNKNSIIWNGQLT